MSLAMSLSRPLEQMRHYYKSGSTTTLRGLVQLIREDYWTHNSELSRPGFHAIATHRIGVWLRHMPRPVRAVLGPVHRLMYVWVRNLYGIELSGTAVVGRRVCFPHQGGIVIHPNARIGDDCLIRQNVTVGALNNERVTEAPVLGDRVELGAGAAVIGRVKVGDDVRVGPNAVVMASVPAASTVIAPRSLRLQLAPRARVIPRPQAVPARPLDGDPSISAEPVQTRDAG